MFTMLNPMACASPWWQWHFPVAICREAVCVWHCHCPSGCLIKCSWPALQLWTLSPSYLEISCCLAWGMILKAEPHKIQRQWVELKVWCGWAPLWIRYSMWLNKAKQFQELLTRAEWLNWGYILDDINKRQQNNQRCSWNCAVVVQSFFNLQSSLST